MPRLLLDPKSLPLPGLALKRVLANLSCPEHICGAFQGQGSPLRADEFVAYQAELVAPIASAYRGYHAYQLPPTYRASQPWKSSNLIGDYDVRAWSDGTTDYYNNMAEAVQSLNRKFA